LSIISTYLRDKINIIHTSKDINGVITETVDSNISARIEDKNEMVKNQNGQEVTAMMFIIVGPSANLGYSDKIQIVTKDGEATITPTKKYAMLKVGKRNGLGLVGSHWEAWL